MTCKTIKGLILFPPAFAVFFNPFFLTVRPILTVVATAFLPFVNTSLVPFSAFVTVVTVWLTTLFFAVYRHLLVLLKWLMQHWLPLKSRALYNRFPCIY